jgi:hypothetical protein
MEAGTSRNLQQATLAECPGDNRGEWWQAPRKTGVGISSPPGSTRQAWFSIDKRSAGATCHLQKRKRHLPGFPELILVATLRLVTASVALGLAAQAAGLPIAPVAAAIPVPQIRALFAGIEGVVRKHVRLLPHVEGIPPEAYGRRP